VRYLSAEWIDAAARALAADTALKEATADVALTLEQRVTGVPHASEGSDGSDDEVRWHVAVDHGAVTLAAGPAPASFDVRFTTDYATAAAIAQGRLGAQQAFAEGRLRVGGDVTALGRHHRAFAAVDDGLAGVRAETTFPEAAGVA
jgi:predicted lipid carrier protein YhbT